MSTIPPAKNLSDSLPPYMKRYAATSANISPTKIAPRLITPNFMLISPYFITIKQLFINNFIYENNEKTQKDCRE